MDCVGKAAFVFLVLAATAASDGEPAAPRVDPPSVSKGATTRRMDPALRLVIHLTREGVVLFDARDWVRERKENRRPLFRGLKPVTLSRLGADLNSAVSMFHAAQQGHGESGFERDGTSRLNVVLRADREACWLFCLWIQEMLVELRYSRVSFAVKKGSRDARLPFLLPRLRRGRGTPAEQAQHGTELYLDLLEGEEPDTFRYRFGKRVTDTPAEAAGWVALAAKKAAKSGGFWVRTMVRAQECVPVRAVVGLLAALRSKKVKSVYLAERRPPPRGVKSAAKLPRPDKNTDLEPRPATADRPGGERWIWKPAH